MEPYVAPHLQPRQSTLSLRSPALSTKVDRFQSALTEPTTWRRDQLFVSWAGPHKGKPITKQCLANSFFPGDCFVLFESGSPAAWGLSSALTRGLATSWALFRRVNLQGICAATHWSSSLTFVCLYMLDDSVKCVVRAVLLPHTNSFEIENMDENCQDRFWPEGVFLVLFSLLSTRGGGWLFSPPHHMA